MKYLVLVQNDAERVSECFFEERVIEGRLVAAARGYCFALLFSPPYVWIDCSSHDRAWPDNGNLNRNVVQVAGSRAAEHLDLCTAFDLKDTDRVTLTDGVIHLLVLEIDAAQIRRLALFSADELNALLDEGEHSKCEKVDLDESGIVTGILVPLTEHPVWHCGDFERHDLDERLARDDHTTHMLGDVSRQAGDLDGEVAQITPQGRLRPSGKTG